jgi:hypothetical protein
MVSPVLLENLSQYKMDLADPSKDKLTKTIFKQKKIKKGLH